MLGKPIIVAADTNMDHLVNSAISGLVVTYGDVRALEAALARLVCDDELRLRLGENARRAYEASYSWSIMQARMLKLYSRISE